ncbi:HemN family oxidoreductase [Mannheimia haemolytica]|uniref:HemN family oxidoreductase n=1 Tax=Mannheimia haemolytica TaxID=75985 RepID=A0A378N048_MANHA|nr:HemN family oxidoreductase [Mannheimia haemolytica]
MQMKPKQAIKFAQNSAKSGLQSFNIDLMHGLPNQSLNKPWRI